MDGVDGVDGVDRDSMNTMVLQAAAVQITNKRLEAMKEVLERLTELLESVSKTSPLVASVVAGLGVDGFVTEVIAELKALKTPEEQQWALAKMLDRSPSVVWHELLSRRGEVEQTAALEKLMTDVLLEKASYDDGNEKVSFAEPLRAVAKNDSFWKSFRARLLDRERVPSSLVNKIQDALDAGEVLRKLRQGSGNDADDEDEDSGAAALAMRARAMRVRATKVRAAQAASVSAARNGSG
jgi:hypothetical protein